jgi:hypothetical protein
LVNGPDTSDPIFNLSGPVTASTAPLLAYVFSDLPNGSYTITPSRKNYTYVPSSIAVTLSGADAKNQNFNSYFGSYSSGTSNAGSESIWFADATHGWGVNFDGAIQTWNGTQWTQINSSLIPISGAEFRAVSGSSMSDVWAVGLGGAIVHWNGSTWSAMTSPLGTQNLFSVWSRAADDAWIGGQTANLHWNGTSWTAAPNNGIGTFTIASSFWGSTGTDVWLVAELLTARWDGTIWKGNSILSQPMNSLWGFAANDVWAVGDMGSIQHWNGSTWAAVTSPTTKSLRSVWGSSPNDIWAAGYKGVLLHWDGSVWASRDSGTDLDITSVYGSGSTNVWIAGVSVLLKVQ